MIGTGRGYLLHLTLCAGQPSDKTVETKSIRDVVMQLVQPYIGQWRRLTMDNFYNFVPLYKQLYDLQILATGTIRPDRQQFPDAHKRSGTAELRAASKTSGGVICSQHPDLPAMFIVSYYRTHLKSDQRHYITTAHARPHHFTLKASERRRAAAAPSGGGSGSSGGGGGGGAAAAGDTASAASARAAIGESASALAAAAPPPAKPAAKTIPNVAADYNARMNVIDEANRWSAMYTPWRRTRRWWFSIIIGLFHIAVANAWVLYRCYREAEQQEHKNFAQWTDTLARELIDLKPRKRTTKPNVAQHSYAQEDGAKRPVRGRCSICCSRTVELDHHSRRTETQVGRKTSWFCTECSTSLLSKVYVCDAQPCRIEHAVHPPPAPVFRKADG